MAESRTLNKDPAMAGSGRERILADLYETEEAVTEALCYALQQGPFYLAEGNRVWEPACGNGKMARVLRRHFKEVAVSDLHDYGWGHTVQDFLALHLPILRYDALVTNPPYSQAQAFIKRALDLNTQRNGVVAMLLRSDYDSAVGRRHLFRDHNDFCMKVVLLWRPWWFEKKPGDCSPRHNYAWYIWKRGWCEWPSLTYASKEER